MLNIIIKEGKYGITEGGFACGPIPGCVNVTIKFADRDNNIYYFTCSEFEGFPEFYITEFDVFDELMNFDNLDENRQEELLDCRLSCFGDIDVSSDYEELIDNVKNSEFDELKQLFFLLIYLTRATEEDTEDLLNKMKDKPILDIKFDFDEDELF